MTHHIKPAAEAHAIEASQPGLVQVFARKMARLLTPEELEWIGGAAKAKKKKVAATGSEADYAAEGGGTPTVS